MHNTIQMPSPPTPNPQSTTINQEHALSPSSDLLLRDLPPEISGGSRDGSPTVTICTSPPSNLAEPLVATVPLCAAKSPDPLLITSPGPVRRSSLTNQDLFLPVASIAGQSSEKSCLELWGHARRNLKCSNGRGRLRPAAWQLGRFFDYASASLVGRLCGRDILSRTGRRGTALSTCSAGSHPVSGWPRGVSA